VCCSVLQCVAVCCSVLQCIAVCYSALQTFKNFCLTPDRLAAGREAYFDREAARVEILKGQSTVILYSIFSSKHTYENFNAGREAYIDREAARVFWAQFQMARARREARWRHG